MGLPAHAQFCKKIALGKSSLMGKFVPKISNFGDFWGHNGETWREGADLGFPFTAPNTVFKNRLRRLAA